MIDCMGLMANRGWNAERKVMAMHDFFTAKNLYAEFNKFIARMK